MPVEQTDEHVPAALCENALTLSRRRTKCTGSRALRAPSPRGLSLACGTRLNTDRPTREIVWPGEKPVEPVEDVLIPNREEDFVEYMHADVEACRRAEDQFIAGLVLSTGEVP